MKVQERNWARYANPELRDAVGAELAAVQLEVEATRAKIRELDEIVAASLT